MSFFDEFNNITPYFVKVTVGKNKQSKTDPTSKSVKNHKGKMIAFNKKVSTLEELEQYGIGEYMTYLPAEQVSMPIDIQITSDENLTPIFEESSKYTNKEITNHRIRIFNNAKAQIGYVSLSLTPSGDIDSKTSFYESPDRTETIRHTIYNQMKDEKLIKDDAFEFQKNGKEGTKKVEVIQRDGRVVASSVVEQELETQEDVQFQSITEFAKDEKTPKLKKYVASCVVDEIDRKKRGGSLIPWECMTLEDDLFEYQKAMDEFERHVKWVKERTGVEITIERALEIDKLSYDERKKQGIPRDFNDFYYCTQARYLSDDSNNLLRDFKGNYIGNILRLTDKGYEACIVTKHQKDGLDYRLYTIIDLSGTSITRGTGLGYLDIDRDPSYFERLRDSDKTPTFVTRIREDGKEELVLYKGNAVSGECQEYESFVEGFITPLKEIQPIKISKILNKESEKEK